MMMRVFWLMVFAVLVGGVAHAVSAADDGKTRVVISTYSTGFRHQSIEEGAASLAAQFRARGMAVSVVTDTSAFRADRLAATDVMVLVSTTTKPDMLETEFLAGDKGVPFRNWVNAGGRVVGIHAAVDSHYAQDWFNQIVGARFAGHPKGTYTGKLNAKPGWGLASEFMIEDEWYLMKDVQPGSDVLVTLDPVSVGLPSGPAWPISWTRRYGEGRIFYTNLGHRVETFADPRFRAHVDIGMNWVLRTD